MDARIEGLKKKHRKTLQAVFAYPLPTKLPLADLAALLEALGAEVDDRGNTFRAKLGDRVFTTHKKSKGERRGAADKGFIAVARNVLRDNGIEP